MNFRQLVTETTRPASTTCLDHIWANRPERVVNIRCPNICISDHLPVLAMRLYKHCSPNKGHQHKSFCYRDFKNLDHAKFIEDLEEAPWDTAFLFDDVEDIAHGWYSILNEVINAHVPLKHKRVRSESKPKWLSPNILQLMRSRDHLLKKAKRSNDSLDWSALRRAKNKVTTAIRAAKKNFFYESLRESHGNSKKLWSTLRDLTGKKNSTGVTFLQTDDSEQIRDPALIAEAFNQHFTGLAERLIDKNASNFDPSSVTAFVEIHKSSEAKLVFPDITVRQTQQLIEAIPSGKATGVDGVSARLLKIAAPAIAPSLTRLINKCISNGVFPRVWKEAKVTPLHKGDSKSEKNNYRPISVLPVLSKIFERHLHNSLFEYLCSNNLLYYLQSGFRKFFSTETALVNMIDKMLWNLDKNCVNGLILADFQKAFDLVDHGIMIQKLQIYGLEETSLELLRSYLSDRKQRTVIGNVYSSSQSLAHGVPQGSVLAPLLFLIFINDLAETMPSKTSVDIFADDTTLSASAPFTDITGLCAKLCESTRALESWTKNNRFKLNTGKTKSMVVSGNRLSPKTDDMDTEMEIRTKEGVVLERTTSHKLLGVHIDQDLSFNDHVDYMCKKLAQRIGTLRSIRHYLPLNERLTFYNAIIKPVMMYGGLIWGSTSTNNIRRVFRLQKRAARVILGVKTKEERTIKLFKKLEWLPFYDEINVIKLCLVFKCLNGQCPEYLSNTLTRVSDISTRQSRHGSITLRCRNTRVKLREEGLLQSRQ